MNNSPHFTTVVAILVQIIILLHFHGAPPDPRIASGATVTLNSEQSIGQGTVDITSEGKIPHTLVHHAEFYLTDNVSSSMAFLRRNVVCLIKHFDR